MMAPDTDSQSNADSNESDDERRAPHRVSNDQGTGNGSATALSKLKMIERKKSEWQQHERPSGE